MIIFIELSSFRRKSLLRCDLHVDAMLKGFPLKVVLFSFLMVDLVLIAEDKFDCDNGSYEARNWVDH